MALHNHLLIAELLSDVARSGARDVDPEARHPAANGKDEGDVEDGVERINPEIGKRARGGHVVGETTDGDGLAGVVDLLPLAKQVDEHVALEALVEELGDEVHMGDQRRLENDRNVGGVKELDGVGAFFDWKFNGKKNLVGDAVVSDFDGG